MSLYGLFDRVLVADFEKEGSAFSVFVKLRGGNGEFTLTLRLIDPKGNDLKAPHAASTTVKCRPGVNVEVNAHLIGVKFNRAGVHKIVIELDGTVLGAALELGVKHSKGS